MSAAGAVPKENAPKDLKFATAKEIIAEMVKLIRQELFDLLEEKIKDPLLNLLHHERGEKVISVILNLINAT
ncbi:hypothetical protein NQ317_014876 [Molorchus minor]|uniref:RNA helicase C-terminal domain-containing protein n=1 Tax=Molorchus minor TaxID=1323400 RepID=A0ABQ9J4U9_9CUCU|nr:hypothetical protein NQ317_014876 [Molorchus minor]